MRCLFSAVKMALLVARGGSKDLPRKKIKDVLDRKPALKLRELLWLKKTKGDSTGIFYIDCSGK